MNYTGNIFNIDDIESFADQIVNLVKNKVKGNFNFTESPIKQFEALDDLAYATRMHRASSTPFGSGVFSLKPRRTNHFRNGVPRRYRNKFPNAVYA